MGIHFVEGGCEPGGRERPEFECQSGMTFQTFSLQLLLGAKHVLSSAQQPMIYLFWWGGGGGSSCCILTAPKYMMNTMFMNYVVSFMMVLFK